MDNYQKKTWINFAAGWLKQRKDGSGEFVSAVANGEKSKVQLQLVLEDGNVLPLNNFVMSFNTEKRSEKSPDVRFSCTLEQD